MEVIFTSVEQGESTTAKLSLCRVALVHGSSLADTEGILQCCCPHRLWALPAVAEADPATEHLI